MGVTAAATAAAAASVRATDTPPCRPVCFIRFVLFLFFPRRFFFLFLF